MEGWPIVIELLVLLTAALICGTLAGRLKQSAIVGYLLAGAVVGPNVLGLVASPQSVQLIAELGIALLLFTIGLEFSVRRLRRLGVMALAGGSLQVLLTGAAVFAAALIFDCGSQAAVALGAMIALSSTATVLRLLHDSAAVESLYGRSSVGILLLQDAAVLPLTLLVSAMARGTGAGDVVFSLGKATLFAILMSAAFLALSNLVVPRLLNLRQWADNREFPILLAIILAAGSATAAQQLNISPAIGAFLAGVLLGESPFAVQIRADVASMKTVFVTVFFASVGMFIDPAWVARNWVAVTAVVAVVIVGKTLVTWGIVRALGLSLGMGLAVGLCLAQVGEFSFVLAELARGTLITDDTHRLIVSVTGLSLLLTPYLVAAAPRLADALERKAGAARAAPLTVATPAPTGEIVVEPPQAQPPRQRETRSILIIGFGPAGQRVAEALIGEHKDEIQVVELNPRTAAIAQRYELPYQLGNASQMEVLQSARIDEARVVIITVPDPVAARQVIHLCRSANPDVTILARARYHAYRWELQLAGAESVIDEEDQVGMKLAAEAKRILAGDPEPEE